MPYYCTVPRCTSMAGKAKNVSFHQFPRDEELARLWNNILKRGKPYTKYSKVCSLHFRPEDYTITSVGKNKGQWRTLRKDAIPSQNLPSESPGPTTPRTRSSGAWVPSLPPNVIDTRVQQQMAQAIYMQTMLAMQAATNNGGPTLPIPTQQNSSNPIESMIANTSNSPISEIEQLLQNTTKNGIDHLQTNEEDSQETQSIKQESHTSYKCEECSKCFKDPDVFVLHSRTHKRSEERSPDKLSVVEKENLNANSGNRQETLRANPILANLLKSSVPSDIQEQLPSNFSNVFDVNNILSIENQIMTALAANMENYIRNLSSMLAQPPKDNTPESSQNDYDENSNSNDNKTDDNENIQRESDDFEAYNKVNVEKSSQGSPIESTCDNEDLNESKDSSSLVIDEKV